MARDELLHKALKAGATPKAKAPGKAKAKSGASAVLSQATAMPSKPIIPKDEGKSFFETPVIKSILDALSTGVYSAANWADFATAGEGKRQQIDKEIVESAKKGDLAGAAIDLDDGHHPHPQHR